MTLGATIRQQRLAKGLGLREVARQLGLSASYVSDIEHDRRIPSETVLRALAHVLGADVDSLITLSGRLGDEAEEYMRRTPRVRELVRILAEKQIPDSQVLALCHVAENLFPWPVQGYPRQDAPGPRSWEPGYVPPEGTITFGPFTSEEV